MPLVLEIGPEGRERVCKGYSAKRQISAGVPLTDMWTVSGRKVVAAGVGRTVCWHVEEKPGFLSCSLIRNRCRDHKVPGGGGRPRPQGRRRGAKNKRKRRKSQSHGCRP